ncbi:TAFII55 protein conserved region-domain-containing protein [Phyllosticta paracitricarpa]
MSSPDNPRPTIMKLKLNSGSKSGPAGASDAAAQSPSVQTPSVQTPGGSNKIKIKWGGQSAQNTPVSENPPAPPPPAAAPAPAPQPTAPAKPKRKYTKKADKEKAAGEGAAAAVKPTSPKQSRKRKNEGGEDGATGSAKKTKPSLSLKTGLPAAAAANTKMSLKIRNTQPKTPTVTRIKVKHAGKPPPRLPGYGYDSEDDEAEEDPSIEHAFILRMMPGPDCDYLAKAISEKKIGVSLKEGGADVSFRFFDRDGRRACVTIKGHHYAASLLDLPCVVEGMKSWERKGAWYKTTDICQLLLVWAQVDKEEDARTKPLPKEIDDKTWQYPHGLTPPMHYVRKRRFRPRVARHVIDAVEEELERLLTADKQAKEAGGESVYELVDPNKPDEPDEDQDQSAVEEEGHLFDAEGEDVDADALTALMEQQLEAEDEPMASVEAPPTANDIDAAHVVAAQALGGDLEVGTPTGPEGETPGASAAGGDTEQEASSGSDADDDDDDEIDEAALAAQEEKAQLREEVADLKREVDNAKQQMERQNNPLLKQRLMAKVKSLMSDLELKKASLGDDDDE